MQRAFHTPSPPHSGTSCTEYPLQQTLHTATISHSIRVSPDTQCRSNHLPVAGLWLCDTRIVSVASPPPPPDAFIGCYTLPSKPRFSPVLHRGHPNLGGKCLPFGCPAEINPSRIREWLSFLLKSQMHPWSSSSMMLLVFPLPRKMKSPGGQRFFSPFQTKLV